MSYIKTYVICDVVIDSELHVCRMPVEVVTWTKGGPRLVISLPQASTLFQDKEEINLGISMKSKSLVHNKEMQ